MKLTTAGESHGKALAGIIEGLPSNLCVNEEQINAYLALRQSGYGRGGRQNIERDKIQILSGVRRGKALGSPLAFIIENKDYRKDVFSAEGAEAVPEKLTRVRPGHADLAGMIKYDTDDARNILERASARETAVRVAAGAIAIQFLKQLNIEVVGYIKSVCGIKDTKNYAFDELKKAKGEPLFMLDNKKQKETIALLDKLKAEGDTAGGVAEVRVKGLKSGFGSCMQYSDKLDARLACAVMGVQSVKGVEIGLGFKASDLSGSSVHDAIYYNGSFYRSTNNAGGIEGGMSNGEEIVLRAAIKPVPTLMRGLDTVDFVTKKPATAATERSDVCAVCAAEIIVESVVAFTLAEVILKELGGSNMREVTERYNALR